MCILVDVSIRLADHHREKHETKRNILKILQIAKFSSRHVSGIIQCKIVSFSEWRTFSTPIPHLPFIKSDERWWTNYRYINSVIFLSWDSIYIHFSHRTRACKKDIIVPFWLNELEHEHLMTHWQMSENNYQMFTRKISLFIVTFWNWNNLSIYFKYSS